MFFFKQLFYLFICQELKRNGFPVLLYMSVSGYPNIKNKMATKKVIEVNESSVICHFSHSFSLFRNFNALKWCKYILSFQIVDLKAELFRKEQQFRHESGTHKVKADRNLSKVGGIRFVQLLQ